jgi:hypothetical protein
MFNLRNICFSLLLHNSYVFRLHAQLISLFGVWHYYEFQVLLQQDGPSGGSGSEHGAYLWVRN